MHSFQLVQTSLLSQRKTHHVIFSILPIYFLFVTIYSMKYHHNYYNTYKNNMNPHHNLPNYYCGDPYHVFDCILNWKWIHQYTFVLYILMKPTFWGVSYNRNMYDPMILLHIRTNYYFGWWYWYTRRLITRIYRIILSRRVALLYFCVVYYHETCLFRHFKEQKHWWYYDISTYEN